MFLDHFFHEFPRDNTLCKKTEAKNYLINIKENLKFS